MNTKEAHCCHHSYQTALSLLVCVYLHEHQAFAKYTSGKNLSDAIEKTTVTCLFMMKLSWDAITVEKGG